MKSLKDLLSAPRPAEVTDSKLERGRSALHNALYAINNDFDPGISFLLYRFNVTNIFDEHLDSVAYCDEHATPTLGINFTRFDDLTPLGRVGTVQHTIGHVMCGHLGEKTGRQLREYCIATHGNFGGALLYSLATEIIADCYITYPGAMVDNHRPFYDITKLGPDFKRFDPTIKVINAIKDSIPDTTPAEEILEKLVEFAKGVAENPDDVTEDTILKDMSVASDDAGDAAAAEDSVRRNIKDMLQNTANGKKPGYLSGDAEEYIAAEKARIVIPWEHKMLTGVSSKLSEERRVSNLRVNRRVTYYKGRSYDNTTSIVFCIDTSGSMGPQELSKVDAQVKSAAQFSDDVFIIQTDSNVAKCIEFEHGMSISQFMGRGGTSFMPALQYVYDELPEIPNVIVYYTDGYGTQLDDNDVVMRELDSALMWILTPEGMGKEDFRGIITKRGTVIKVDKWC